MPVLAWASKLRWTVHQQAINRALAFLPARDRRILCEQQALADGDQFQTNATTFRHAMRSPLQSVEDARTLANRFVREQIELARELRAQGNRDEALRTLGFAMHTLQDATSPAHEGFQVWDERWNNYHSSESREHFFREKDDPGANSRLDATTRRAWDYFEGRRPLPTDFFAQNEEAPR
jgi:hypothetical protein